MPALPKKAMFKTQSKIPENRLKPPYTKKSKKKLLYRVKKVKFFFLYIRATSVVNLTQYHNVVPLFWKKQNRLRSTFFRWILFTQGCCILNTLAKLVKKVTLPKDSVTAK